MTHRHDNISAQKPRALLIGGQGFVGRNLAPMLVEEGYEVLSTGLRPPRPIPGNAVKTATLDARDAAATRAIMEQFRPTLVVDLLTHANFRDIEGMLSVHEDGADNLVAAGNQVPEVRRFILFSTSLVQDITPADLGQIHNCDLALERRYALCHLTAEGIVRERLRGDVAWTILRPASIWGPHFSVPFRKFFTLIAHRRYWHVGGGSPPRHMAYVGNLVYQFRQVLAAPESVTNRRAFFCADYVPYRADEWANLIAGEYGLAPPGTLPGALVSAGARIGDLLALFGMFDPPLTTRRLSNMRKGLQLPLDDIRQIAPDLPYDLRSAVAVTNAWLRTQGVFPRRVKSPAGTPTFEGSPPCASA
jgi:nucleoside-diphosphate-sugar epimerase